MGAPVRTQEFYRPILEDIRRTAVRWKDGLPWFRMQPLTHRQSVCVVQVLAWLVCGAGVWYLVQGTLRSPHTNVRRELVTNARWEIRPDGTMRVVYLTFPDFPRFAEEAVVSERLVEYLETQRPEVVRARMVVSYDFDEPRTKGPTLTVDGIEVEE
jgi:hypothetical protein